MPVLISEILSKGTQELTKKEMIKGPYLTFVTKTTHGDEMVGTALK